MAKKSKKKKRGKKEVRTVSSPDKSEKDRKAPKSSERRDGKRSGTLRLPSWYPLVLFMLAGIIFRLSVALWEPLPFPDSTEYLHLAGEIRSGDFFSKDYDLDHGFYTSRRRPPFYSLLLAPFAGEGFNIEHAGIIVSLLMSTLTFIPLYFGAVLIFSKRTAVVASAILCFHYFTLLYASQILSEATFTALYMGMIAVSAYGLSRPSLLLFTLGGILGALLCMTRETGLTAVPLFAAGALVKLGIIDRLGWRRVAGLLAALAISFILVSAPYLAHIRIRTGQWGLTTQMSGAGITRMIMTFDAGQDDSDQFPLRRLGRRGGEDESAVGFIELVKLAPSLAAKTGKNMWAYGVGLVRGLGLLLFAFMLIGGGGAVRDYFRRRDRESLFMALWTVIWIIQLWALYSLVTPYMVDERYMYPLMVPGIMLAGFGMAKSGEWIFGEIPEKEGQKADNGPAARISVFLNRGPLAGRLTAVFGMLLVAAAFFAQLPAYMKIHSQFQPENLFGMFSSGHKTAALEMKSWGLAPPGKMICARKPFMPYYLEGQWYRDMETDFPMPKTFAEIEALVRSGKIDYLVADSYTLRTLRPGLTSLAFALKPLSGARVIYSRYFDEYQRVITVYECRIPEPPVKGRGSAKAHVKAARELFRSGYLVFAYRETEKAIELDPNNRTAWEIRLKILDSYYQCAKKDDATPTMMLVPDLLPEFVRTAETYARLNPNDMSVRSLLSNLAGIYKWENESMKGYKQMNAP